MTVTFLTFSFTFTVVVQFATLKVCTFLYFFKIYIFLNTMGNNLFLKKFIKTDTSLYFLTLEMVALPTKCLSNPTNGSVLIGNYRLGHAHLPKCEAINRKSVY